MDLSSIFTEYFLDFGNYINDFDKSNTEIYEKC